MIIELIKYFASFVLILLIQLLVINNIELTTYVNPYIYIIFILSLPVTTKPWHVVVISFGTGMIMDTFSSTPGLHMAAVGFMGYFRNFYLQFACSKEDYESRIKPSISRKGIVWFLVYVSIMTLMHHMVLFYLEIYSLKEFFRTLLRVLSSSFFTVLLISVGQILFYPSDKAR
ncbi:MAG: rod shape-determining protein MreD [bacterium]|nr:rod shape-determining protein MreD [bacterium]